MIKKIALILPLLFLLIACSSSSEKEKVGEKSQKNNLIVRRGNEYTEFYKDKLQVKMHGYYDKEKQRHGVWEYYTQEGIKISTSMYWHGVKEGFSIVYYPNGAQRYVGEYKNGQKTGKWDFYDNKGNLVQSKTF